MSTDQPQLTDFEDSQSREAAERREALRERGAVYGPSEDATPEAPSQEPENECLNCERELPPPVARVLGDNNGNVRACSADGCEIEEDEQ